jgi:hypothetical protein
MLMSPDKNISPQIDFGIVKSIPEGMANDIELAVVDFMRSSHVPAGVDLRGFYNQTLQAIANSSVLGGTGTLWLGVMDGKLVTYLLTQVSNDYDGRLAYTVTQAWVRDDQRGQPWVKWAWSKVRQHAKDCFCKHFVVLSSRGHTKAYCRFLGKGFRPYAEILKEEI